MVPVTSLWLPILLSGILVFVASSLIHMALPWHRGDYKRVPSEDDVMEAMRRFNVGPGDYLMPRPASMADMRSPEFIAKRAKGPIAVMTVMPPGPPGMAKQLATWFVYSLVVAVFGGYVAGIALGSGAPYLSVFRIVGTVTFAGYSLALFQHSIWYGRSWSLTLKSVFDGLIYALLTAGAFGWLWPR